LIKYVHFKNNYNKCALVFVGRPKG